MRHLPEIRSLPTRLEHLALGHCFADVDGRGAGPARLVWFCLWTHRRSGVDVFPGNRRLADMTGATVRQVQDALRFLDRCELLERGKRQRSGTRAKRLIRLQPRVQPTWEGMFQLPPLPPLRDLCGRDRDRPHVDVAVMLGLYLVALECRVLHREALYSDPFCITWACLADLLGLGRNTPRRSIDRLRELDLVRATHPGDDWSSGLRVAGPRRWLALANQGDGP